MRRDMDLIRTLMIQMADHPAPTLDGWYRTRGENEAEEQRILGHLKLLHEAGLIRAVVSESNNGIAAVEPLEVTWRGHDFVDNARNETVWGTAKATVAQKGGSVSFAVFQEVLKSVALKLLGLA
jgi:hypothetical protein